MLKYILLTIVISIVACIGHQDVTNEDIELIYPAETEQHLDNLEAEKEKCPEHFKEVCKRDCHPFQDYNCPRDIYSDIFFALPYPSEEWMDRCYYNFKCPEE